MEPERIVDNNDGTEMAAMYHLDIAPTRSSLVQEKTAGGGTTAFGEDSSKHKAKICLYFFLWFALSVGYNIFNKNAVKKIPLPWLIATFQMFAGIPLISILWLCKLRKVPQISFSELKTVFPLAVFHSGAHLCACLAMYAGSVSFAHIIKAAEPISTSLFSIVILSELLSWKVYVTLLPVVSGVALASISEPAFSWLAFATAMGANVFSSLRGVYSKQHMSDPVGTHVCPRNLYGIVTIMSFLLLAPLALIIEGPSMVTEWNKAVDQDNVSVSKFILNTIFSGLAYYSYNEMAFSTLELVSPVTHAVGSTFKRVFIIGSSIIIFGNYPDALGYIGMTVAIAGVGVYSLAKQKYKTIKPVPLTKSVNNAQV